MLAGLTAEQAENPRWDLANNAFWTAYFVEHHHQELEDTNDNGPVSGQKTPEGGSNGGAF